MPFTTLGYWAWSKPFNSGTCHIYVIKMKDWRHFIAVLGHELIEIAGCWLTDCTTEEADKWDECYEQQYAAGRIPKSAEPGHDPKCPYHVPHMIGVAWEYFWIYLTCGGPWGFRRYEASCNAAMGITEPVSG